MTIIDWLKGKYKINSIEKSALLIKLAIDSKYF